MELEEINQEDISFKLAEKHEQGIEGNFDKEIANKIKQIVFADDQLLSYSLTKEQLRN